MSIALWKINIVLQTGFCSSANANAGFALALAFDCPVMDAFAFAFDSSAFVVALVFDSKAFD